MGNVIIDNRIAQLTEHKRQLLKMKKVDRGDGLKRTNDAISRLKRWNNDLGHKNGTEVEQNQKQPETTTKNGVMENTIEAVKDFGKAMTRFANMMTEKEPEGQKEEQIAPVGVQMYNGTLGSFYDRCAKGA